MTLNWEANPILLEHHPGPSAGAIWVILPEEKVVFVGDAVLKNQPPFLANADLPAWQETLALLQSKEYRDYKVISGRSGVVTPAVIKAQAGFLKETLKKIERLAKRKRTSDPTENLAQSLLSNIKTPASQQKQYLQRLRYGLQYYFSQHYNASGRASQKED
jgi:glyoxylase-like metal-dependent hydrolase (beta-lactamase superfamily II)